MRRSVPGGGFRSVALELTPLPALLPPPSQARLMVLYKRCVVHVHQKRESLNLGALVRLNSSPAWPSPTLALITSPRALVVASCRPWSTPSSSWCAVSLAWLTEPPRPDADA